jgi:hypothetical protein
MIATRRSAGLKALSAAALALALIPFTGTAVAQDEWPSKPDMHQRIGKLGMQGAELTPDQITAFQKAEVAKWAQVIKSANIKLE